MPSRPEEERPQVFISHQWKDKQVADRLARDLENLADVWMDFRNLLPGDRIQEAITEALERIHLVLVVWTEHASSSANVRIEIEKALEFGVRVVPCFFVYLNGEPHPPLNDHPLEGILGVDFHHHGSGIVQVANLLLELQTARLPEEAVANPDPRRRMLQYMKGYLSYMANYRNLKDVPDQRAEWVDKIVREIERYLASGGEENTVRMLLEAARQHEANDPEATGMLVDRLERLVGEASPTSPPGASPPPPPPPADAPPKDWRPPAAPPADLLAQRIATVVPPGTGNAWLAQVNVYIESAPVALQALRSYVQAVGSPAGSQVVAYLERYLQNADDLVPDHAGGRYGLLDDAWVILNTAFRLIESRLVPAEVVPLNWKTILATDHLVRAILPEESLAALTTMVFQILEAIAAEASSYQPWFSPDGRGYAPTIAAPASTGGTWEDQMNAGLLGTGLSV